MYQARETPVENGKQRTKVDGKSYLLETALRADFPLVHAFLADYLGNLQLRCSRSSQRSC